MTNHILILEDNAERIAAFEQTVSALAGDWSLKVWRDAPSMIAECVDYLPNTRLISLDHDLNPLPGVSYDPGTGVDVTRHLSLFPPVCPVILHSSNHERVYSMHNELRFAGWTTERVGPLGEDWIGRSWRRQVEVLLAQAGTGFETRRRDDHDARVSRSRASLEGLAIGDGIGEMLFGKFLEAQEILARRDLPTGPWLHTDDTEMALSLFEVLKHHGFVQQDSLSRRFARRFDREPFRGYGRATMTQMQEVNRGADWRVMARSAFEGQGSLGNGGAMRVAPLGAYFGGEPESAAREAALSAEVTHTHPEGIAGTIAVAVAAAVVAGSKGNGREDLVQEMFAAALEFTPPSRVRTGLEQARAVPLSADPLAVGLTLGNGALISAPDTVPFALWCAARHLDDYPMALAASICSGGDCDTNAAIVGGIVAAAVGLEAIPAEWRNAMEPLKFL